MTKEESMNSLAFLLNGLPTGLLMKFAEEFTEEELELIVLELSSLWRLGRGD